MNLQQLQQLGPDILIIDEVLGAGDGYFVNKCAQRVRNLVDGTTLILVSHSLDQITNYCERVLWLNKGNLAGDGSPSQIIQSYKAFMGNIKKEIKGHEDLTRGDDYYTESDHRMLLEKLKRAGFIIEKRAIYELDDGNSSGKRHLVREVGDRAELQLASKK